MANLVILVILLGAAAFWQLMNVNQLSNKLKNIDGNKVTPEDNKKVGRGFMIFFIGFFIFCAWQFISWKDLLLPEAASEHGKNIDWLFNFNMVIITIPFVITHVFLAYFAYKYAGKENTKATFYSHNNKLEMIWTIVPAVVLTVIIGYGLKYWNNITDAAPADAIEIEMYAQQFSWTGRLSGEDNKLGGSNYKLIAGANELGVDMTDKNSADDKIVKGEIHLPVGKAVNFKFRSRDVIHSAYFPHFRAQMNCVPGMVTSFHFVPTITTAEMRKKTNNPKFDYLLLCAKICGATHWNMQMNVIIDTPEDYAKWVKEQKTLAETLAPAAAPTDLPAGQAGVKEGAAPAEGVMKTDTAKVAMK